MLNFPTLNVVMDSLGQACGGEIASRLMSLVAGSWRRCCSFQVAELAEEDGGHKASEVSG